MSTREEALKDIGYEEPLDGESPVDVPEGWKGGTVKNTGGNIMCRTWRNFDFKERQEEDALEVIYDVSQDNRVGIQRYEWNGNIYRLDRQFDSKEAEGSSDMSQARVAQSFMKEYPK